MLGWSAEETQTIKDARISSRQKYTQELGGGIEMKLVTRELEIIKILNMYLWPGLPQQFVAQSQYTSLLVMSLQVRLLALEIIFRLQFLDYTNHFFFFPFIGEDASLYIS